MHGLYIPHCPRGGRQALYAHSLLDHRELDMSMRTMGFERFRLVHHYITRFGLQWARHKSLAKQFSRLVYVRLVPIVRRKGRQSNLAGDKATWLRASLPIVGIPIVHSIYSSIIRPISPSFPPSALSRRSMVLRDVIHSSQNCHNSQTQSSHDPS